MLACHGVKFKSQLTAYAIFLSRVAPAKAAGTGIAAVADVFDALTSQRPHKGRWEPETAAREISSLAGSHFDPGCVTAFLNGWDEVLAIHDLYRG